MGCGVGWRRMACVTWVVTSEVEWACINVDCALLYGVLLVVLRARGAAVQVGRIVATAEAAMRRRCTDSRERGSCWRVRWLRVCVLPPSSRELGAVHMTGVECTQQPQLGCRRMPHFSNVIIHSWPCRFSVSTCIISLSSLPLAALVLPSLSCAAPSRRKGPREPTDAPESSRAVNGTTPIR